MLPVMMFEMTVGDAVIRIPVPMTPPRPFVTVKPRSTDVRGSPDLNVTTCGNPPPSMTVDAGPAALRTSMALPLKSMCS